MGSARVFSTFSTFFTFFTFFTSSTAFGLPSYRRLFEKQYGYAVSCVLCHTKGGGSPLNAYGLDFQKAGAIRDAFARIGPKDSDGDRTPNSSEIEKKSNPGDAVSTPADPGPWLDHVEAAALPLDQLRFVFPAAQAFSAMDGSLFPDQKVAVEARLGEKLDEGETLPTFYFAIQGSGAHAARTGVALFMRGAGPHGSLVVATAVDLQSRITAVKVLAHAEGAALHGEALSAQFTGKTAKDPLRVGHDLRAPEGLDEAASRVAALVRKSLLVIQTVFEKRKR